VTTAGWWAPAERLLTLHTEAHRDALADLGWKPYVYRGTGHDMTGDCLCGTRCPWSPSETRAERATASAARARARAAAAAAEAATVRGGFAARHRAQEARSA
jgi:hypothetical protein